MNTSISFIIPAYNAAGTLKQCLDSLSLAMGPDDEVIIVNDASLDNTLSLAQAYDCRIISLLINQGAAHARNQGAGIASKDLIVFIDSDVLVSKSNVDKLKKYFHENKNVQTLTMNVDKSQKTPVFFTDFKNLYMNYIISESKKSVNYVYGSFCASRKNGFVSWPENLRLTEDSLWGYKQKSLGLEIHCLKDVLVTHFKCYSFKSLISNDFNIASYFARSFLEYSRWNTLYTNESFGHTSKSQKLSVMMAGLCWILLLVNPLLSAITFGALILLNSYFFKFIYTNRGLIFTFKSVLWYVLVYHVYLCGIAHGGFVFLNQKIKVPEREIA